LLLPLLFLGIVSSSSGFCSFSVVVWIPVVVLISVVVWFSVVVGIPVVVGISVVVWIPVVSSGGGGGGSSVSTATLLFSVPYFIGIYFGSEGSSAAGSKSLTIRVELLLL